MFFSVSAALETSLRTSAVPDTLEIPVASWQPSQYLGFQKPGGLMFFFLGYTIAYYSIVTIYYIYINIPNYILY